MMSFFLARTNINLCILYILVVTATRYTVRKQLLNKGKGKQSQFPVKSLYVK